MSEAFGVYKTYLYVEGTTAGKYHKLVDITSAGATGSAPGKIDTTTFSDPTKVGIPDRPETPAMEFEYNYNKTDYAAVAEAVDLITSHNYMIVYPDNSGFKFPARGSTYVKEASDPIKASLSLIASAMPEFVEDCSTLFETSGT